MGTKQTGGTQKPRYADPSRYESLLKNIMKRLNVPETDYDWDFSRQAAWIDFKRNGKYNRFEHSVQKAAQFGEKITNGADAFAQLVMTLGDLELAMRRGTYTFDMFVSSLPALPAPEVDSPLPDWALDLGFRREMPRDLEQARASYRALAKVHHADAGGSHVEMAALNAAMEKAEKYFQEVSR
jgi:hypothetical protein